VKKLGKRTPRSPGSESAPRDGVATKPAKQNPSAIENWPILRELFGIDPRSLALFRIVVGVLLLSDLLVRAADISTMYTDDGMFPSAEICRRFTTIWNWSFHFATGTPGYQGFLFIVAAILALALLVGLETRLACIGSWLMLVSIHHRVPAIISGAEVLLRMLLFWGMFLPLGKAWSVDFRRQKSRPGTAALDVTPVVSVASAAILLQMGLMYLMTAVAKTNAQWIHGEALAKVFAHSFYASPAASLFLGFPAALKGLTWISLVLEWAAPFLLFSPRNNARCRLVAVGMLILLHLAIGICLEVGLFSFVAMAGLTLFLPGEFWNSRFVMRLLPGKLAESELADSQSPESQFGAKLGKLWQGVCAAALVFVLAVNFDNLPGHPLASLGMERWRPLTRGLGISQNWAMFDQAPSKDGWYVARAKLRDGSEVDLLRNGAAVDWTRPAYPGRLYPNHYWQKIFREMTYFDDQGYQVYRAPVAQYLCHEWNARNNERKQVAEFEFIFCERQQAKEGTSSKQAVGITQLVRLDFSPDMDRPVVSGYGDANQSALDPGGR
jgi:hypothetical protein